MLEEYSLLTHQWNCFFIALFLLPALQLIMLTWLVHMHFLPVEVWKRNQSQSIWLQVLSQHPASKKHHLRWNALGFRQNRQCDSELNSFEKQVFWLFSEIRLRHKTDHHWVTWSRYLWDHCQSDLMNSKKQSTNLNPHASAVSMIFGTFSYNIMLMECFYYWFPTVADWPEVLLQ